MNDERKIKTGLVGQGERLHIIEGDSLTLCGAGRATHGRHRPSRVHHIDYRPPAKVDCQRCAKLHAGATLPAPKTDDRPRRKPAPPPEATAPLEGNAPLPADLLTLPDMHGQMVKPGDIVLSAGETYRVLRIHPPSFLVCQSTVNKDAPPRGIPRHRANRLDPVDPH